LEKALQHCPLTMITFTKEKLKQAEKPKHIGEGLLQGTRDFGMGLFKGVTGIVAQPIKGAKEEGGIGFAKGLGRGILGAAVKPIVGTIDLVSKTTEGIRNTTSMFDKEVTRSRPPRFVSTDGVLLEYTEKESLGFTILNRLKDGAYRAETYTYHQELEDNHVLLVTNKRLIMVAKARTTPEEEWTVELNDIKQLDLTKIGLLVHLEVEPEYAIIPSADQTVTLLMYTKLGAFIKDAKIINKR